MALTIRNITQEQIDLAKEISGKGTASGAVVACVEIAQRRIDRCNAQEQEIRDLKDRINHLERIQAKLANAADEALTIIRQRELL